MTEQGSRWLQRVLAGLGALLLAGLAVVLLLSLQDGPAPSRITRVEHCDETPVLALERRDSLAHLLGQAARSSPGCWRAIKLPSYPGLLRPSFPGAETRFGLARFRFSYQVPADWPEGEALMIYGPRAMGFAWQVGVNGVAINDNLDDWRMTWNRPLFARVPAERVIAGQTLAFELTLAYMPELGYSLAPLTIGRAEIVARSLRLREILQTTLPQACSLMLLVLGAFFLCFWFIRRAESAHLLLALASVAWNVCNLQYVLPRTDVPALADWYDSIVIVSVVWFMWLVYLFVLRFDSRRNAWIEQALPKYVLIMTVLCLPFWGGLADTGILFLSTNACVAAAITFLITRRAWQGGSIELRVISASLIIALLAGTHDIALLAQWVTPESFYVLPFSGLLVFGSFLFAMQRRYVAALDAHEMLSASLTQRLAEREAALVKQHQRLWELERIQALSQERQRLMRDIHDGLGSTLTSSLVAVERGHCDISEVSRMLRECMDELRLVIDSLDPTEHDLVALLATLRFRMGRRLDTAGIQVEWEMEDIPSLPWMGPPEVLQVLRVVQEMLCNVIKHAHASRIQFSARRRGDCVEVRCADNGCGFDARLPPSGRGLPSMANRCAELGGRMELNVSCPGGTEVRILLPLESPRGAFV